MNAVVSSFVLIAYITLVVCTDDCNYKNHHEASTKKGDTEITPLKHHKYSVSDTKYVYTIGICSRADDDPKYTDVAVIQANKTTNGDVIVIGRFSDADIMGGTNWVILTYNSGDQYDHHCIGQDGKKENRRAKIMFICDPALTDPSILQPAIVEEQNEKDEGCYYLFEINTAAVCKTQPVITVGMSIGSILLIVFVCVAAFYLLAGILYKRFVLHAKGLEQIPNISFWQDFGNLEADGCDLVCRSRKSRQSREYKGLGDEQLGDTDLSPDDGLLPM